MHDNNASQAMRVTIICGAGMVSGKEIMALELGQGLRTTGHSVNYVATLWGDGKFRERLNLLKFPLRCMRLGFISATLTLDCLRMTGDQLLRVPGLWLDYRRFLSQARPEHIIHTNWQHVLALCPFLKIERDWLWLHECIPDQPQYRHVFRWLSRRLRGFVPVSNAVRNSLLTIGIPDEKIQVIHNGLSDPAEGLKSPLHTPGLRIGIAGQVGAWKGHQDLIEAFALLAGKHAQAELHVFGTGDYGFQHALKARVLQLELSQRVVWHGFVTDRREIYEQIDICVVPSRTPDPLPTTAIEAAFFGLPVVATNQGGLPEIINDSVTGFIVEAANPAALASRLDQLLSNANLRQQMGSATRLRAELHFSRDRFVAEFTRLLNGPVE